MKINIGSLVCAAILMLLGLVVLYGWILHVPVMIQIFPGLVGMVLNTSVCFFAIGVLIVLLNLPRHDFRIAKSVLILFILTLASMNLIEDISALNLGVDHLFVKPWLNDANPTPGRMAPNTAVGFILSALVIAFIPYGKKTYFPYIILTLTFSIFLIALVGLIVYSLKLEYIFASYSYTRMALHTGCGFLITSIGLWLYCRKMDWYHDFYTGKDERKILSFIAVFFISISLIAGFGTIAAVTYKNLGSIHDSLENILSNKINIFSYSIDKVQREALAVIADPYITEQLSQQNFDKSALNERMKVLSREGFGGFKLLNSAGDLILSGGTFVTHAQLPITLQTQNRPVLFWNNGFWIKLNIPIYNNAKTLAGYFIGEKKLELFNHMYFSNLGLKRTGEILVCGLKNTNTLGCYPTRLSPNVFYLPTTVKSYSAIGYTLDADNGQLGNLDYHNARVISAFGRVGKTGLDMVAKIDTLEVYKPIHDDITTAMLIAVSLIVVGLVLLRGLIQPLVLKIIDSEKEAHNTKRELQESENRYALAVKSSNTGLWDWDVGTENIFYSTQFKHLVGYHDDELTNNIDTFKQLLHPDDHDRVFQAIQDHLINHTPYNIQYRLKRKTGEYHWFQAIGQAIWDDNGRAIRMAGSLSDISERKKSESLLTMQYLLTKTLSEAESIEKCAKDVITILCEGLEWPFGSFYVIDKGKNTLKCIATYEATPSNKNNFSETTLHTAFSRGLGLPGRVWASGQPRWINNVTEDPNFPRLSQAKDANIFAAFCFPITLQKEVKCIIEFFNIEIAHPDKEIFKITQVVSEQIAQFINRKEIEAALKNSETHKAAILDSASDSIITLDENGVIQIFNYQTTKIFQYDHEELNGLNIKVLIPDLSLTKLNNLINKAPIEFSARKKNGDIFSIEITLSAMEVQKSHRLVGIIRDITERKRVEKLKSEFVSVVSHELRTPLTSIRGSLGLILSGKVGEFTEKAQKFLNIANNNCERLLTLINDILDIEKIEAGKMRFNLKAVDIENLVEEAIENNQMYAQKFAVKLVITERIQNTRVYVDPDRFMQVLTNLISNAVKFSPAGASVDIAISKKDDNVRVAVADKGPGIAEDFKSKIFQRFSQADSSTTRSVGGTGLGLSITKAIVEKLGGTINFDSKLNEGSMFYIDIPEWREIDIMITPDTTSHRILICEDDEDQANYIRTLLRSAGYESDIAYSVKSARICLAKHDYKALLLDLILPDQDGITFIKELRSVEKTRSLPIIVLSVVAAEGRNMVKGNAFSIVDWLDKPLDFNRLLYAISLIEKDRKPKILHVEDDSHAQELVVALLKDTYDIETVSTLESTQKALATQKFDLIILDLVLPDGNAQELLPQLAQLNIPIIIYSANYLDPNYSKMVREVLMKQTCQADEFRKTVNSILREKNKEDIYAEDTQ